MTHSKNQKGKLTRVLQCLGCQRHRYTKVNSITNASNKNIDEGDFQIPIIYTSVIHFVTLEVKYHFSYDWQSV